MQKARGVTSLLIATLLWIPALGGEAGPGPAGSFLVRDVRVFDGERVLEHRSVLVAAGRILRVGGRGLEARGARLVDGRGRTLLPGLIDAHVHIGEDVEGSLGQAVSLGVTTVLDMYNGGERLARLKRAELEDAPDLADLRTAGSGATAPGGHPAQMGGPPMPTLGGAEEAESFIDARIAEGSDYIKVIYDDLSTFGFASPLPMLSRQALQAVVRAAHRRGKLAVVHVGTEGQARDAIEAGADGLAHLFRGASVSADFGQFAKRHRVFIIPTLSTLYSACGKPEGAGLMADERLGRFVRPQWRGSLLAKWTRATQDCTATDEAVRQLARARVPILAGTDAPVPGTTYGASLHGELALLVRNGLTPIQALAAATSATARAFRLADRGSIRSGLRADLVLVEGDPTRDILATRSIVTVWKRGEEVRRVRAQ